MSDKPTKGPWRACTDDADDCEWEHPTHKEISCTSRAIIGADGCMVAFAAVSHTNWIDHAADAELKANVRLIAEAGTVYHETGKTPREQQEQIEQLREALQKTLRALEEIGGEMTVGDRFTCAGQSLLDALDPARAALSAERKTT